MTKAKTDIFEHFVGRDEDLRELTRFSLYEVMLYRTNLYTHSHRVAALTRLLNPLAVSVFSSNYDPRKAEILALVHDDAELIFGDIQAGNKSKMTTEQLQEVKDAEERAIEEIAKRFPKQIAGYSYQQLLQEAADYSSLEAQVVCYADKYDALGESLHEIYAGNHSFTTNIVNEYGHIPTPIKYYTDYFKNFAKKFPDLKPLLNVPFTMFDVMPYRDYAPTVKQYTPHTLESLTSPTDNAHYSLWRQVVQQDTNDEVCRDLYIQKETL